MTTVTDPHADELRALGWLDCDTCGLLFDPELCDGHMGDGFDPVHGDHPAWCSPCYNDQAYYVRARCVDHDLHTYRIAVTPRHAITVHTDRARGLCQAACTCGWTGRLYDVAWKANARRSGTVHREYAQSLDRTRAKAVAS